MGVNQEPSVRLLGTENLYFEACPHLHSIYEAYREHESALSNLKSSRNTWWGSRGLKICASRPAYTWTSYLRPAGIGCLFPVTHSHPETFHKSFKDCEAIASDLLTPRKSWWSLWGLGVCAQWHISIPRNHLWGPQVLGICTHIPAVIWELSVKPAGTEY